MVEERMKCQRPKRASFISTFNRDFLASNNRGVNALNGLLSFLHTRPISKTFRRNKCQRPKRASFISTDAGKGVKKMKNNKCQRPKRASFISTVPSGTPRKHWLSSSIFAGICLNFLIITVFREFFGMFTLCSYFPHIIILSHAA